MFRHALFIGSFCVEVRISKNLITYPEILAAIKEATRKMCDAYSLENLDETLDFWGPHDVKHIKEPNSKLCLILERLAIAVVFVNGSGESIRLYRRTPSGHVW